jgi:serine/threonine protein kinase
MYVGAHLPLDVFGGALVGLASASLIHLILGVEDPARDEGRLVRILREAIPDVHSITPLVSDAKASSPFIATVQDGSTEFMKVSSRVNLFGDQVRRTFRRLYFARTEDLSPYVSNKQKVDHEAFVLLLAERAGVHVPALADLWYDRESDMVFLFQQRLSGHSFDSLDPTEVSPGLFRLVFEQVASLHRARIAHRDLRLANLVLDQDISSTSATQRRAAARDRCTWTAPK